MTIGNGMMVGFAGNEIPSCRMYWWVFAVTWFFAVVVMLIIVSDWFMFVNLSIFTC